MIESGRLYENLYILQETPDVETSCVCTPKITHSKMCVLQVGYIAYEVCANDCFQYHAGESD